MTTRAANLLAEERPALAGWVLAAIAVVLGHALLAWMLLARPPADDIPRGSELAAVLIDLAPAEAPPAPPEQPAPRAAPAETQSETPPVEQPPEPAMETPSPPQQPDRVAPMINVPAIEVPVAPKPEVVLAQPGKPPPAPQMKKLPAPKKAAVTRAVRPPAQRHAAAPSAAPPPGVAVSATDVASWRAALVAQINRNMRYPDAARARGEAGTAMVSFTLDRRGNVIAARLAGRSGSQDLDQEALAIVRRASPLPAPPAGLAGGAISLTVPLRFSVR